MVPPIRWGRIGLLIAIAVAAIFLMAGGYFVSITRQKIGILSAEIGAVSSQLGTTHKQLAEMSSQEDQEIAALDTEIQD